MARQSWQKTNILSWAKSNQRPAALLLAFAVVGSVMIFRSFAAEDVVSYDSTKPVIPQLQRINSTVKRHTVNYKSSHPDRKRKGPTDPEQDKLASDIKTRKKAMKIAIMSHPNEVAALAMPNDIKNQLPDELQKEVETTTELTGTWATGHSHASDGKVVGDIRDIVTSDGAHHQVFGEAMPNLEPGRDIRIKGVQADNIIGLASSGSFYARTEKQTTTVKGDSTTTPNVLADTTMYTLCAGPNIGDPGSTCIPAAANNGNLDDNPIAPATTANFSNKFLIVGIKPTADSPNSNFIDTSKPITMTDIKTALDGTAPTSMRGFYAANSFNALNVVVDIYSDPVTKNQWVVPATAPARSTCLQKSEADATLQALVDNGNIKVAGYKGILMYIDQANCDQGTSSTITGTKGQVSRTYFFLRQPLVFVDNVSAQTIALTADHEVGHALGLSHAHSSCVVSGTTCSTTITTAADGTKSIQQEYGNAYSAMGSQWLTQSNHYTAFEKYALGWAAAGGGIGEASEARGSNTYSIGKLEAVTAGKNFGLRIPIHRDANNKVDKALYLEYRPANADIVDDFKNDPTDVYDETTLTPGLLINEVSGKPEHLFSQVGPFPATEELLNSAGANHATASALTAGQQYRYHQPEAADDLQDICITFTSGNGTIANVSVDRGCGVKIDQVVNTVLPTIAQSPTNTFGTSTVSKYPYTSNSSCIDPKAHQLYVADYHRVLSYELDDSNKLKDNTPDHVLGASSIFAHYDNNAPVAGIDPETFSVRWTGKFTVPKDGAYGFQTVSDDGVRVWIDGAYQIGNWTDHIPTTDTAVNQQLTAGQHDIKIEYYNNTRSAVMQLFWRPPDATNYEIMPASAFPTPLQGDYYNNGGIINGKDTAFTGTMVRWYNSKIDNPWAAGSTERAPTFADQSTTVTANSINGDYTNLACDPDGHRLFVSDSSYSINGGSEGSSRILVFDTSKVSNGMAASWVLGQPDMTSANSHYSSKNRATYWQANTFYENDMAYSTKRKTLFVAQSFGIPRVLAFDLSTSIANGMNASYVIGKKTGDFTTVPYLSIDNPWGSPSAIAVDDANDRLFWASTNCSTNPGVTGCSFIGPMVTTFNIADTPTPITNIASVKTNGLAYVNTLVFGRSTSTNYLPTPGAMQVSSDGNTLYQMSTMGQTSASFYGKPMNVYNVTPSRLPVGVILYTNPVTLPISVVTLNNYTTTDDFTIDQQTHTLYVPNKGFGTVNAYPLPDGIGYHQVITKPSPDPYKSAITIR